MRPGIAIIIISGMPTEDALINACKMGVYTFLEKPFKVVFISLLLAVSSYIFIGSFREVVNLQFSKVSSFMNKVEGYLQPDEQRELQKEKL